MERRLEVSRIRLRHFNCLVAVSQERNLGKAAAKLRLSQPAVSKTLSELETILGVRLFQRGRLGAQLTRDGEAFLVHAVSVLDSISAARNAVGPDKTPSTESVFVGALPTVAPDLLPTALSVFRESRPQARVVIQTAANAPLLEMLKSGAIDFAVGRMAEPRMMAGLAFELLFVEPLVLAVRAGHPLGAAGAIDLGEVLEFPLIVTTQGTIPRHNTESYLRSRGFRLPHGCIETISVSVARLVALRSDAVWFTPAGAVREDVGNGSLVALDVSMEGTEEPVGMLHRTEGVPRPPALDFMKILREAAAARRLAARG